MAGEDRRASDRLTFLGELQRSATALDFHLVMRRLECFYPELPRWGSAVRPSQEPIRLGQEPSLAFPHSMLASFEPPRDGRPGSLWVRFFGLFGPGGPLPIHVTDYVRDRLRNRGDSTLTSFLNLFNHRLLILFHRAWAASQPTAAEDRPDKNPFDDYVGSLIGLGMASLKGRTLVPDRAKLQYAGRLAMAPRNAEGLGAILRDHFRCKVDIEEFIGEWLELPADGRWRLGWSKQTSTLGMSTVIGKRMWRCDNKFRVVMGPLSADDYHSLLPGNPRLQRLAEFVRSYTGDALDFDVRLILAEDASRQVKLGRGDRLGLFTQLGKRARGGRRDDIIIHPGSYRTQRSSRKYHDRD